MKSELYNTLYSNQDLASYEASSPYNAHILEQYKVYLASAESISNRRQTANAFFVSLNTALVSLLSYLSLGDLSAYWLVAIVGAAVSYMWYRLIKSYKDLNTAKFKVIHEIEKSLPIQPFDAEWQAVGRGNNSSLYLPFTKVEIFVPWIFFLLHLFVFLHSVMPALIATSI